MKVLWTEAALAQLAAIRDYISQTSPEYAHRVVKSIFDRSQQLIAFPRLGPMVPEYELDEVRQVMEGPYRLIYLVKDSEIEVLAVIHTSRRPLSTDD